VILGQTEQNGFSDGSTFIGSGCLTYPDTSPNNEC
jgi:hypothetical protein